jgi:hypothetical protein
LAVCDYVTPPNLHEGGEVNKSTLTEFVCQVIKAFEVLPSRHPRESDAEESSKVELQLLPSMPQGSIFGKSLSDLVAANKPR